MTKQVKKSVVLMANLAPGLRVAEKLRALGDTVVRLYVADPQSDWAKQTIELCGLSKDQVFEGTAFKDPAHVAEFKKLGFDYIITAYWPYLLKPEVFEVAREGTVNFHPALLPINRGWYPHVHSIIDGTPMGVTLHAIDAGADTGPIWAQRKVAISPLDTAKSAHEKLQAEILGLFDETWPKIKAGEITPKPQDHSKAIYRKKKDVDPFDALDLDKTYTGRELINILRARSFGDLGFAHYQDNGETVYVNLRLSKERKFG